MKVRYNVPRVRDGDRVSIPSRGFWFFEGIDPPPTASKLRRWRGVSIPSRGFWFFEATNSASGAVELTDKFQSPRGDFGFLKASGALSSTDSASSSQVSIPSRGFWFFEAGRGRGPTPADAIRVSIPSRGFWFFEVKAYELRTITLTNIEFQSPRGDFGFLKITKERLCFKIEREYLLFQSPRGDFGFLKATLTVVVGVGVILFQSPRGDFGFLKIDGSNRPGLQDRLRISIPSRGFWFFEAKQTIDALLQTVDRAFQSPRGDFGFLKLISSRSPHSFARSSFNPLAGILVF